MSTKRIALQRHQINPAIRPGEVVIGVRYEASDVSIEGTRTLIVDPEALPSSGPVRYHVLDFSEHDQQHFVMCEGCHTWSPLFHRKATALWRWAIDHRCDRQPLPTRSK